MRAFLMLYGSDYVDDTDRSLYTSGKSRSAERRAFILLSSVCSHWYYALIGWPQSSTFLWSRHQLKKQIERECTHFC